MEYDYMTAKQLKALMAWMRIEMERIATERALQGYVVIGEQSPEKLEKIARRALAEAFGVTESELEG
jgi:hypothetical protein